jgi:flavin reductase (DIM6/NTAB) family NADH-FMN oxidoreductase RutF
VLVSWVQQAAFEPPSISVCLKRGRPIQPLVDGSRRFLLHAIGDPPTAMLKHFGKGFSLDEDAFAGLRIERTEFGPMIAGCLAYLAGRVRNKAEVGDHDLYAAEVVAASADGRAKPYTHLRASGFSY